MYIFIFIYESIHTLNQLGREAISKRNGERWGNISSRSYYQVNQVVSFWTQHDFVETVKKNISIVRKNVG